VPFPKLLRGADGADTVPMAAPTTTEARSVRKITRISTLFGDLRLQSMVASVKEA
jgi:hypothetical protein